MEHEVFGVFDQMSSSATGMRGDATNFGDVGTTYRNAVHGSVPYWGDGSGGSGAAASSMDRWMMRVNNSSDTLNLQAAKIDSGCADMQGTLAANTADVTSCIA